MKVFVAARTVHDVKLWIVSFQKIEIPFDYFVEVSSDQSWCATIEDVEEQSQRRFVATVIHRTCDAFEKFVERPRRIAEHLHFFARLGQVRRKGNVFSLCDFLATAKQATRRGEQCVRAEAPLRCLECGDMSPL